MKQKIVCILGLAAMSAATMVLLSGCSKKEDGPPAKSYAALLKDTSSKQALQMAASLTFVRHTESGLCFAYGWDMQGEGGALLATVPCDKVEKLLVNKLP